MTEKRWQEIAVCQHKWSDYFDSGCCATPYCEWTEQRCSICGIYSRSCQCGFEAGLSGEPRKRETKRERRKQFEYQMRRSGEESQCTNMSFTDRKPFQVTAEEIAAFTRHRKRFNCKLCGHIFQVGDTVRWIYANFKESPVRCGNFFVCSKCDATDEIVLQCARLSFEQAEKLAKQWDIYGPEWQQDAQQFYR